MLTWTTYGTWLQGDERGYVKDGKTLGGDRVLMEANKRSQAGRTVHLSAKQKRVVHNAILREGALLGQRILALAVCSNHVHLVAEYITKPVGDVVAIYKAAGRKALNDLGIKGKVWTKGFDKRFCFDRESMQERIDYVNRHAQ